MNITCLIICFGLIVSAQVARSEDRLTLDSFLKEVQDRNLNLKIESSKVDAAVAKSVGISIPPPIVGVTEMQMQDGASARGFEVTQSIPFPTKMTANHSARKLEAEAQKEMKLAQENEIMAQAKLAYIALWASQERLSISLEKRAIILQHIQLSTSAVRSSNFLKLHVLKAESDRDFLENETESLRAAIVDKQLRVAQFLNADLTSFKPILTEPPLSSIPQNESFVSSHQLEFVRLNFESFKAKEREAKSSWLPEFELRYKEMGETSMYPKYKEYMVGVSVPFAFFWEPYSASSAAKAESLGAELQYRKEKQKIEAETMSLINKAQSLKNQLSNLKDKLLPRAERRMKIAHNLAPRDMETLQDHRETLEAFPDLKLKTLDLREQYEEVVSELEKYISKRNSL